MKRRLAVFLFFCSVVLQAQNDSLPMLKNETAEKHTFYVVPTLNYSPETSWGIGVAGANYFKFTDYKKISSLSYSLEYTKNRQFSINATPKFYFGGEWYLYGTVGFKRYPDYFYGIGNHSGKLKNPKISYLSDRFYLHAQLQYFFAKEWSAGVSLAMRGERLVHSSDSVGISQIIGSSPYFMWGLGALVCYDSRDNLFYPLRGLFFKAYFHYYEPFLGSSYRMGQFFTEVRQFIPLYKEFVFAWQFVADAVCGKCPFQMLPTFGGIDVLRGFRRGVWSDEVALALQAEFRIPIWKRFKAAVFCSVADAYNWEKWHFAVPKVAYGAGFRFRLNKAKVNLRLDVARSNYGNWRNPADNWSFYFTASEAF